MRQILSIFSAGVAVLALWKYRYRVMNVILRYQLLRKLAITTLLRIPFFRKQLVGSLFAFPGSPREGENRKA
ncbi:hypothetical protein [Shouchella shacheensis]|uniref:hypothetical protein n=1 Tax=Shouchella shacheensis TaxID=1649580 RepID=UPI000AE2043D|nr:hypothetical protein [Shouchella shacheensis]